MVFVCFFFFSESSDVLLMYFPAGSDRPRLLRSSWTSVTAHCFWLGKEIKTSPVEQVPPVFYVRDVIDGSLEGCGRRVLSAPRGPLFLKTRSSLESLFGGGRGRMGRIGKIGEQESRREGNGSRKHFPGLFCASLCRSCICVVYMCVYLCVYVFICLVFRSFIISKTIHFYDCYICLRLSAFRYQLTLYPVDWAGQHRRLGIYDKYAAPCHDGI